MALAALLLGLMAGSSSTVAADPGLRVNADTTFGVITIDAEMLVPADAKTAWAVLTDYDNLSRFVPEMQSSRVTSAPGQPKRLEQRGKSGMLSFFTPEHIIFQLEETPPERIKFNKIAGDVRSMRGEWLIVGNGNPVKVFYRARIVPKVPLPPLLGATMIELDVESKLAAIRREIARRAFSSSRSL
jgi:ribosome-associated toxin RatA of RatAB toxin-antitoxin module